MSQGTLEVECPRCGQKGQVPDHCVGQTLRCKKCDERFVLRVSGWVETAGRSVEEDIDTEHAVGSFRSKDSSQDQRRKVQTAGRAIVHGPKELTVGIDSIWMFARALERELLYLQRHSPLGLQHWSMLNPLPDVDVATLRQGRCDAACRFGILEDVPILEVDLYRVKGGILCVPLSADYDPWFWPKGRVVHFCAPADYRSRQQKAESRRDRWELLLTFWLWPAYLIPFIGVVLLSLVTLPAEFVKWLARCLFSSDPKD